MPQTARAPSTPAAQAAAARLAGVSPPKPVPVEAEPATMSRKEVKASKKAKGAEGEEGEGKKKKPVKLIAAVLLLLVVGYVVKGKVMKPHYAAGAKVPLGQVVALSSVTTNLADGHLAQVGVSLQLTKPASTKQVGQVEPQLVSTVVSDLGRETYGSLLPPAGRAAFRAELLKTFQQILGTTEGAQVVSAVYITGFVLQ